VRGKDDVSGPLDLLAERREGRIALEAGGAVVTAGGDRDQDVFLDPGVLFPFRAQLVGVHLELVGATGEGGDLVGDRLVVSLTKADQVRAVATKGLAISRVRQRTKEPPDLLDMLRVVWRNEEMEVDWRTVSGPDPIA
jgi:hypothetical protein